MRLRALHRAARARAGLVANRGDRRAHRRPLGNRCDLLAGRSADRPVRRSPAHDRELARRGPVAGCLGPGRAFGDLLTRLHRPQRGHGLRAVRGGLRTPHPNAGARLPPGGHPDHPRGRLREYGFPAACHDRRSRRAPRSHSGRRPAPTARSRRSVVAPPVGAPGSALAGPGDRRPPGDRPGRTAFPGALRGRKRHADHCAPPHWSSS